MGYPLESDIFVDTSLIDLYFRIPSVVALIITISYDQTLAKKDLISNSLQVTLANQAGLQCVFKSILVVVSINILVDY